MPYETGEDSTPMKRRWNSSNISVGTNANASMDEGEMMDTTLMKSYFESSKLSDLDVMDFLDTDVTMDCIDEDDELLDGSLLSLKSLEKSRASRDSGVSSMGTDYLPLDAHASPIKIRHQDLADCKYKISIYSKVSGCRMTNLTDYWIVKQVRVAILQRLTNGDPHKALNYKFGYEKMANGGLQIISDSQTLIDMLGSLTYFAGVPCKMTFPDTPRVVGFIKGLPTDLEPSDLKDEIRKTYPAVYSVRYVTEKSRGFAHGMQRPCAFVSFNLRFLPKFVKIFEETFELQVPNPMQCTRCSRYGHQGKQCRAQARCSFCGGTHQRQLCTAKTPLCINCQGAHTATSHDCPIWQQGKLMNELRYRGGMSAEEAIGIASSGKISQKKHSFTQADFFANQDCFFFNNDTVADDEGMESVVQESPKAGKIPLVHPRACRIYPFLDLMTDFFLKVKNPGRDFTSSILMPGYDDSGFPIRKVKKDSVVAQKFKETVKAMVDDSPNYRSQFSIVKKPGYKS